MFLYTLTLNAPSVISHAEVGHFSGGKRQELAIVRHQQHLELCTVDTNSGQMGTEHSQNMFCRIRSIAAIRLPGGSKDYLVLGTDAGALTIVEYTGGKFVAVQHHEFGRSGLRRQVAGQYVVADPRGRAVMVAAVERTKLVYVVTRDGEAQVQLASPLEAGRAQTVSFDVAAVDVGFENPVFAALESAYGETQGAKELAYYELDLGLNHVVRRWSAAVDSSAHRLIALPGGGDGPSGVLVCSAGAVEYRHNTGTARRAEIPEQAQALVVASAVHRMRGAFFVLVQTEDGTLFKVTVTCTAELEVTGVDVALFSQVQPAAALCILRAGFLFAAAGGGQQLHQFASLDGGEGALALVDEVEGAGPVVRSAVHNVAREDAPQLFALSGRGAQAALAVVRHGVEVAELAVAELPDAATGVWTARAADAGDAGLIVVGLPQATLALEVRGDVAEVTRTGLATDVPTLCLRRLTAGASDGSEAGPLVQVTPHAVRLVHTPERVSEWRPPNARAIACAAIGTRHVAVALARSGGQIVCLELHAGTGALVELPRLPEAGSDVSSLAVAARGTTGAAVVAAGCADSTVRLFAAGGVRGVAEALGVQALDAEPHAVTLIDAGGALGLFVGLVTGVLVSATVDAVSGAVDAVRARVLGAAQPVAVDAVVVAGRPAVLALGAAPWLLSYTRSGRLRAAPLSYDALAHAAPFTSDQCAEGFACVDGASLRIVSLPRPAAAFNCASIPLARTPRSMALHPESRCFAIAERDQRASLLRVVDPFTGDSEQTIELDEDDAVLTVAHVTFAESSDPTELFLAVACARGLQLRPPACASASVRLYRWAPDARSLVLVHVTPIDGVPQCLAAFGGMLAVGVGRAVRLYALGARQLLRRVQAPAAVPNVIAAMCAHRQRPDLLLVADVQESVRLLALTSAGFRTLAVDTLPRFIVAMLPLDDATVVTSDKFGNVAVLRAPAAALDLEHPPSRPCHWDIIAEFHAGDIITGMDVCEMGVAARQIILCSSLMGAVLAAVPLVSRQDAEMLRALELALRRLPSVAGRDHLAMRSSFFPVRAAVDGDLCELFYALDLASQDAIAEDIGHDTPTILKKLDDMRAIHAL
ncbi:pre-mRNA-splicing factor rse1 [Coemansia guatemalensis]|uniref:Pre-mRNA-splicing factor rse1 n=1 Tax=Coemansia guatemalensis TaxID=2761395 RepID=A0A9W8LV76_9FUNG|nr:pre-mRNA-splicing factor rse1 [Coemansia guatemalensis]